MERLDVHLLGTMTSDPLEMMGIVEQAIGHRLTYAFPAGIPIAFSVTRLLPGYALGFLAGSMGLVLLAANLARREGRQNVTAHAYGNNVPAIIAYTLAIVLPAAFTSVCAVSESQIVGRSPCRGGFLVAPPHQRAE